MSAAAVDLGLALAAGLFALGLTGLLVRRDLIFALLSIEVMLNASALAFVAAGARWGRPEGQAMFLLILAVAAAEVAVGLALALRLQRLRGSLELDRLGSEDR